MDLETITSWRELDDVVAGASADAVRGDEARPALVFRGLARSSYEIRSGLARLSPEPDTLERHLIRNFRKYAHRAQPGPALWDWLALAKHHNLPTRLLDWTFSPLIAAHFATVTGAGDDGAIWAVDCAAAHERLPERLRTALDEEGATVFTTEMLAEHAPTLQDLEALAEDGPFAVFFEPPSFDDRIAHQSAVLSTLSDAATDMCDWLEQHADVCTAWRITADAKLEIRARLDQAGITERVLLPGLDGLAAWLRRYYAPEPSLDLAGGGPASAAQHTE